MDFTYVLQVIFSLIFVLALFCLSALLYRKLVMDKSFVRGVKERRLSIEEQLYIDSKRKLILVKKDDEEFLILIGINGETVITPENTNAANIAKQKTVLIKKARGIKSVLKRKRLKNSL